MADPNLFDIGSGSKTVQDYDATPAAPDDSGYSGQIPLNVYRVLWQEGARTPETIAALASELRNRHDQTGKDYATLITDPNQYGPGSPKSSGEYKGWLKASQVPLSKLQPIISGAEDILTGKAPPTNNYTQHWSPSAAVAFGGSRPSWADDSGVNIGGNLFYSHPITVGPDTGDPDLLTIGGGKPDTTANSQVQITPTPGTPKPGAPSDKQANTIRFLDKYGLRDTSAEGGSSQNPLAETETSGPPTKDGTWYVERGTGALRQVGSSADYVPFYESLVKRRAELRGEGPLNRLFSLGDFGVGENPAGGITQGGMDVAGSSNKLLGGGLGMPGNPMAVALGQTQGGPSAFDYAKASQQGYTNERNRYDAMRHGDPLAATGRFLGQTAVLAPLMVTGEGALGAGAASAERAAPWLGPGLRFLGGSAGQDSGNLLLQMGSRAAQGVPQGAVASALTSGTSDEPVGAQIERGALAGGVFGGGAPALGAGGNLLLKGAKAPLKIGGALIEPFTETGRNNIVDRFIQGRAEGAPINPNFTDYVSGVQPTLAEVAGNPGISTLQRTVAATNPAFTARQMSNSEARSAAFDAVRGDQAALDSLIEHRSAVADPVRENAFANASPVDPTPIVGEIDQILASPAGQRDVVRKALLNIRGKIVQNGADGSTVLQTDPAQLYGIRQAIGDLLSPLAAGTDSDARLAAKELTQVKGAMDPVIEQGAPGFKDYLSLFADNSRPVDEMRYLQSLNLASPQGNMTLAKVDNAIRRIEAQRAQGGVNPAKSLSDDTMQTLYNIREDLRRQANLDLGRGSGSDTYQKLATGNLTAQLGLPTALGLTAVGHHPLAAIPLALYRAALGSQDQRLADLLTNKLLDPSLGMAALSGGGKSQLPASLQSFLNNGNRLLAPSYVPAAVTGTNMLMNPVESPAK